MIKGKFIHHNHNNLHASHPHVDLSKSHEAKSTKEAVADGESCSTSEMLQQVSVLDMEQSISKIEKIDEETEEDGTCHSQA